MPTPTPATTEANCKIVITPVSATIRNNGTTEVLSERVISNADTGDVISRDTLREVSETPNVRAQIETLMRTKPDAS